jgi:hypothetical protein
MNFVLVLCLVIGLVIAAGCLVYGAWRDRRPSRAYGRSNSRRSSGGAIPSHLLQAVKGDRALAHRLLQGARLKYPNKTEKWYIEKVIYDIQRDGAGSAFRRR